MLTKHHHGRKQISEIGTLRPRSAFYCQQSLFSLHTSVPRYGVTIVTITWLYEARTVDYNPLPPPPRRRLCTFPPIVSCTVYLAQVYTVVYFYQNAVMQQQCLTFAQTPHPLTRRGEQCPLRITVSISWLLPLLQLKLDSRPKPLNKSKLIRQ